MILTWFLYVVEKNHIHSGVSTYMKKLLSQTCNPIDLDVFSYELDLEATGLIIQSPKLIIVVIHRSQSGYSLTVLISLMIYYYFSPCQNLNCSWGEIVTKMLM